MVVPPGVSMKFSSVIGNEGVAHVLRRAVDTGRVAPTILFHGRDGVGKKTMAMAFVSYLLCRDRRDGDSCGICSNCRSMDEGRYVDLEILEPDKGVIKIDAVRDAMPRLQYQPVIGPWKVLVIDDAHAMNTEAENAALKSLEEPPAGTLFILITSSPDTLPRTVLSRSFQIPFGPVPTSAIIELLVSARGIEPDVAACAAAMCSGCPGQAFRLLDSQALQKGGFHQDIPFAGGSARQVRLQFSDGVPVDRDGGDVYRLILNRSRVTCLRSSGVSLDDLSNGDMKDELVAFAHKAGPDRVLAIAEAWLDWDAARAYYPAPKNAIDRMVLGMPQR